MPATITSAAIYGLDARPVSVEVDVLAGMPKITVVGLPDEAVSEARERIRSAVKNTGCYFPNTRITINLSPADWRKEGPGFDLPVALALLLTTNQLIDVFQETIVIGELSLSGQVRPVHGVLAVAELAQRLGRRLIVPVQNASEAAVISGVDVIPVSSLDQLVTTVLRGEMLPSFSRTPSSSQAVPSLQLWSAIRGQAQAKRAMTIAAAGQHNVLLVGPPGSGKTMLAQGLRELLPLLTEAEAIEVTKIHSIAGRLSNSGLMSERPFRQPHHTSSVASLVGGGRIPKPGELSLAHHGVLFLDEFPEFTREHVEALRQPLEDGTVTVSRVAGSVQFPAGGMVVAAMNPCPCGYRGDPDRICQCRPANLERYRRRLSGPILDRFDLFISVPRVKAHELQGSTTSDDPRATIAQAQQRHLSRVSQMTGLHRLRGAALLAACQLDLDSQKLLLEAVARLHLSLRAHDRILRVSRTIADLADNPKVERQYLAEALQYRPPVDLMS